MKKKLLFLLTLAITSSIYSSRIYADGMFSVGHKNVSFNVGSGSAYGNRYTILGVNVNYFALDNLSLGVGYTGWFGDDPKINKVSIPVTYYLPIGDTIRPYLGAIYRHTFIDKPYEGYNAYGGRVGVAIARGGSFLRVGWVHEYSDNGDDDSGNKSEGYPEVSGGYSF
ncbi:MAG: hypothetical protein V3V19_03145 [Cocleimonas sp.]